MCPHFNESGWIIQERSIVDFRGSALAHMGNHPNLKFIQILSLIQRCDLLLCCRCRDHILYPLRFGPLFPNDVGILKPKVGLGLDQIEIDLRKVFLGKSNSFMKIISYCWKRNTTKALGHSYAYVRMLALAQDLCAHASCMRMHTQACVRILRF